MKTKKILVSGGLGQLGRSLSTIAEDFPRFILHCLPRAQHDVTDIEQIRESIDSIRPDYYINAAAYTEVDKAEENEELAYAVNSQGVYNISTICKERNIPIIHISTDYVYHNSMNRPLLETDQTNPHGIYATSKREGEKVLGAQGGTYLILRASWIYSAYRKNFVKTMQSLLTTRNSVDVVNDQIGCPCWAEELARDILRILLKDMHTGNLIEKNTGTFNYTQLGTASWYDIVVKMKDILNASTQINAVDTDVFPRAAERPSYSVMNLNKIQSTFEIGLRHWSYALQDCLRGMKK